MATKRLRRFSITTPTVTGARDFDYQDKTEWDDSKSDIEDAGFPVMMSVGPYGVTFKVQTDVLATGYVVSLVCVVKEVTVAAGVETVTDVTYTFADGYLNKDLSVPTDNAGEAAMSGSFRTMVKS